MNILLYEKLKIVKQYLDSKPENIILGWIDDENKYLDLVIDGNVNQYIEFLKHFDGASLGDVYIFSSKKVVSKQFYVKAIPEGQSNWFAIGHISDEPIIIKKSSGEVYRFFRDDHYEFPRDCFGQFDEFLLEYALGKKYLDLLPGSDNDEWINVLIDLEVI